MMLSKENEKIRNLFPKQVESIIKQVKRYIQEQMGKDVFEYDIYGCPDHLKGQLKIGDFCGD